jgi:hypothetical protein
MSREPILPGLIPGDLGASEAGLGPVSFGDAISFLSVGLRLSREDSEYLAIVTRKLT